MRIPIMVLMFTAALAAGPVHADAVRDALADLAKCADIADAPERLKCFDAAVPGAKNALAVPQQQPKEGGFLEWFGFGRPQKPAQTPEEFGKGPSPADEAKEITEITATVLELAKTARGRAFFVLDNGQIWRQLDSDSTDVRDAPAGAALKVTIEKGFLGSYNLTIEGRNGLIKVNRLK